MKKKEKYRGKRGLENHEFILSLHNVSTSTYSVKEDKGLIEIKGKSPVLSSDEQKKNCYSNLHTVDKALHEDMKQYLYPNGPVIRYGWNIEGYYTVVFYENMEISQSQINEIYDLISETAIKTSADGVTVAFLKDDFSKEEVYAGYDNKERPVIGAIKISAFKNLSVKSATLGFPVKDTNDNKGYVTAKHFASILGLYIYQPSISVLNKIGEVDSLGGSNADASFIEYNDVSPEIHVGHGITVDLEDYIACTPTSSWINKDVRMSGTNTGPVTGYIDGINHISTVNGNTYYNQVTATYDSQNGDSGAPVYCFVDSELRIIGIHKGSTSTHAIFSALKYIYQDLDVLPIKKVDYPKGDSNNDGVVDFIDFVDFAATYNQNAFAIPFDSTFDFNDDGVVDFIDHVEFAGLYQS